MSGLMLALAPYERFIVNGALMENGSRPSRIRIKDTDARVLRLSDALKPTEVDTPVKQVYYAIQLLITGDLEVEGTLPAIQAECDKLASVFEVIDPDLIPELQHRLERQNFYSALCHLRQVIVLESQLLNMPSPLNSSGDAVQMQKVA